MLFNIIVFLALLLYFEPEYNCLIESTFLFYVLLSIPHIISKTTGSMTVKLQPDIKLIKEARNQKSFWHDLSEKPVFGNETSRHAIFTKFCRIVTIDVRNKPWKFQIDNSKIGYFTEQSVKWRQMLVCKIQNGL